MSSVSEQNQSLASHPFWDFSLRFYANEAVQQICLVLQDHYHLNVNVVLFCCWLAQTGRGRLSERNVETLQHAVCSWHLNITEALRNLRKQLKAGKQFRLSKRVQREELIAEQVEQLLLAETIIRTSRKQRPVIQKATDALISLRHCMILSGSTLALHDKLLFQQLIALLFPQVDPEQLVLLAMKELPYSQDEK